jgi:hypothetical protein
MFSFPLPGRKQPKASKDARPRPHAPAAPPQWPSHLEEPTAKAHRVLGTGEPAFRKQSLAQNPSLTSPPMPDDDHYRPRHGSHDTESTTSATATQYTKRAAISTRSSSNVLGPTYCTDGQASSVTSTASSRLRPHASNSTMRSHYDAKNSPLSVSQQTSNSAVRDMALRRGNPSVMAYHDYHNYEPSPMSPRILDTGKERRKSKPARLDLTKLFPKPMTGDGHSHSLLSPGKMVKSPAAMSYKSADYFPHPMTRDPTPQPTKRTHKLAPTPKRAVSSTKRAVSPVRLHKRDTYDNAKVNVRRPPKGVQHWFDALDDDSDEVSDDVREPVYVPQASRSAIPSSAPAHKASLGSLRHRDSQAQLSPRSQKSMPAFRSRTDTFSHEDIVDLRGLTMSDQYSLHTQDSTKTKESALSKSNLQKASILSFSSSEDENETDHAATRRFSVRKSLDLTEDTSDIIIGQAEAFSLRHNRRPSAGKMSIMSTSTNAATIDIMYTPEPFTPQHFPHHNFPRSSTYSSRRSSHARQPSVIPERDEYQPGAASLKSPLSPSTPSVRSARTSASEPKPRTHAPEHKLMAVTREEEVLLELMRKKRASMSKKSLQDARAAVERDNSHTSPDSSRSTSRQAGPRFSPIRVVETRSRRKPSTSSSTASSAPFPEPPRGRSLKSTHDATASSRLHDSSGSDTDNFVPTKRPTTLPHHIPALDILSPLDMFPPVSPAQTMSVTSPTTTDHFSPLPSPVTPGVRVHDRDIRVKIARSETSNDTDDVSYLETGVIDVPSNIPKNAPPLPSMNLRLERSRTGSSDSGMATDLAFPVPPSFNNRELTTVSEAASRPPSIIEPPKLPQRNSRRNIASLTPKSNSQPASCRSSIVSNQSYGSTHSQVSNSPNYLDVRCSSRASRESSVVSLSRSSASKSKHNSVSDDVLAAWGSLGGTY